MAKNQNNTTQFTNEVYMYGDKKYLNFYKHYKNAKNSIDDPIITGFTFDIDINHSPLFFNCDKYSEYSESLRGGGDNKLADLIETTLKNMYKMSSANSQTYEINYINTKDTIGESYNIGYGSQVQHNIDNVLYGATEYIYMVDKVKTENDNEFGVYDIGNGTGNYSYGDYDNNFRNGKLISEDELNKQMQLLTDMKNIMDNGDSDSDSSDYESKLCKLKEDHDALHDSIHGDGGLKDEYDKALEELSKAESKYQSALNERNKEIEQCNNEILKLKEELSSKLDSIKNFTIDISKEAISDLWNELENKINEVNEKFTVNEEKPLNNISAEDDLNNLKNDESIIDRITAIGDEYVKYVLKAAKYKFKVVPKDDYEYNGVKLSELKKNVDDCKIKLYGVKDGKPANQGNASPDSIYGKYTNALQELENDTYTAFMNTYNETKDALNNFKNAEEISNYQQNKKSDKLENNYTPSVDIENKKSSLPTQEVPQTVYDMLGFILGMQQLTTEYPYIMKSVIGLDEAYRNYFDTKDSFLGTEDGRITISCYESLDLRISSMFNKYFNAVYDRQYKRERVPVNLRRFNCSIFVHDIRNFSQSLCNMNDKFNDYDTSKIVELALNYLSVIEFKFFDCEILPDDTGNIFNNVANDGSAAMVETNFSFKYGNCVINFLPVEDLIKYYKSGQMAKGISASIGISTEEAANISYGNINVK